MKQSITWNAIVYIISIIFVNRVTAQTYSFAYTSKAGKNFLSNHSKNKGDPLKAPYMAAFDKHVTEATVRYGFANLSKLVVLTMVNGTERSNEIHKQFSGHSGDDYYINVKMNIVSDNYAEFNKSSMVFITDSGESLISRRLMPLMCIATGELKTINGWRCTKWIATDLFINSAILWVSTDVPRLIDFGILYPSLNGGIVSAVLPNDIEYNLKYFKQISANDIPVRPKYNLKNTNKLISLLQYLQRGKS